MMTLHEAAHRIGQIAVAHDADPQHVQVVTDRCRFLSDTVWRLVISVRGERFFFDIDADTLPRTTVH